MKLRLVGTPEDSIKVEKPKNPFPEVHILNTDEDGHMEVGGDNRVDFFDSPYLNPKHVNRKRNFRVHSAGGFKSGFFNRDYYSVLKDLMEIARVWGFSGAPLGGVYEIQTPKGIYSHRKPPHKIDATSPLRVKNNVIYLTWDQIENLERAGYDPTSPESIDSVPEKTLREFNIPLICVGR